jgi:hypothetical protein
MPDYAACVSFQNSATKGWKGLVHKSEISVQGYITVASDKIRMTTRQGILAWFLISGISFLVLACWPGNRNVEVWVGTGLACLFLSFFIMLSLIDDVLSNGNPTNDWLRFLTSQSPVWTCFLQSCFWGPSTATLSHVAVVLGYAALLPFRLANFVIISLLKDIVVPAVVVVGPVVLFFQLVKNMWKAIRLT